MARGPRSLHPFVVLFLFAATLVIAQTSTPAWTELQRGPINSANGIGFIAGPVASIAVDPTNGLIVYIATPGGGVFKTTDGGQTWKPILDPAVTPRIAAVVLDPNSSNTVYALTGYAGFGSYDTAISQALLRSTDAGATWTTVTTFLPILAANPVFAVQPGNPRSMIASANTWADGVYHSSDGGVSWQKTLECTFVFSVFYAGPSAYTACQTNNSDDLLFRSADGGQTWTQLPAPLANKNYEVNAGGSSDGSVLYYSTIASNVRVFARSVDQGQTWTTSSQTWVENFPNVTGFADDPQDPRIVAGVWPDIGGNSHLCLSRDSGATFTDISPGISNDVHAAAFSSDGRLYVGTAEGVWVSDLAPGQTGPPAGIMFPTETIHWTNLNAQLDNMQWLGGFSVSADGSGLVLGGTQSDGVIAGSNQHGWQQVVTGDRASAAMSPDGTAYATATTSWGATGNTLQSSTSALDPSSWRSIFTDANRAVRPFMPLALAPSDPHTVYAWKSTLLPTRETASTVNRSTDDGQTWTQIQSTANWHISELTPLAVDPIDSTMVYGGNQEGSYLAVSHRNGVAETSDFVPCVSLTFLYEFTGIKVDPSTREVWVLGEPNLSSDGSVRVKDCTTVTRVSPANGALMYDVAFDPGDPTVVYAGTDRGVLVSHDKGATWASYGTSLPNTLVVGLQIDASTRTLYAATYGRGMWTAPLPALKLPTIAPTQIVFPETAVAASSAPQTVTLTNPQATPVTIVSASAAAPFQLNSNCGSSLAAQSSCTMQVTFAPTAAGAFTGTLSVTTSASSTAMTVALSGVGTASTTPPPPPTSAPDFSIGANPASVTVDQNGSAITAVSLQSLNGFTGSVALTCTAPKRGMACALSTSTVNVTTAGPSTVNLMVTYLKSTAAALSFAAFLPIIFLSRRNNRRWILLALVALIFVVGCGLGPRAPTVPYSYEVYIQATSGNITHSKTVKVLAYY